LIDLRFTIGDLRLWSGMNKYSIQRTSGYEPFDGLQVIEKTSSHYTTVYLMEIDGLDGLLQLAEIVCKEPGTSGLLISPSKYDDCLAHIEIYDDYRE
jgi:hypothetical protein